MKKILTLTALLLLTVSAAMAAGGPDKKAKAARETVCFSSNIHCSNCAKKVQSNIAYVKGVKTLDISLKNHTITVGYDPAKTNEETLASEIRKLGYTAEKQAVKGGK